MRLCPEIGSHVSSEMSEIEPKRNQKTVDNHSATAE